MIDYENIEQVLKENKCVYERFTFDILFRKLLDEGCSHEEALEIILDNCSLSALVFQERIHNEYYRKISQREEISKDLKKGIYRFSNATSPPRVIGQMSDLIQEFDGRTIEQWAVWYQQRHPDAVTESTRLIRSKLSEFKNVLDKISDQMIELWVKDLVLVKTFIGLKFQEAILKKVAQSIGLNYTIASPEQEARGVDGAIGNVEVSIKPASWKDQVIQREALQGVLIYYQKTDDGLEVEFQQTDFQ
jgi:thermostable 8-oxoguanine DNA glycosylase